MPPKRRGDEHGHDDAPSEAALLALLRDPYGLQLPLCTHTDHGGTSRRNCMRTPLCVLTPTDLTRGIWTNSAGVHLAAAMRPGAVLQGAMPPASLGPSVARSGSGASSTSAKGRGRGGLGLPKALARLGPNPARACRDVATHPVGLQNLGATCYLNSLLQVLHLNVEFRNAIMAWRPASTGESIATNGGPKGVPLQEAADTNAETEVCIEVDGSDAASRAGAPPFRHAGHQPRAALTAAEIHDVEALQRLFCFMTFSTRAAHNPTEFVRRFELDAHVQQDAQEFNKVLLTHFESIFAKGAPNREFAAQAPPEPRTRRRPDVCAPHDAHTVIPDLFRGQSAYATTCMSCGTRRGASTPFYELSLHIQGISTVEEAFVNLLEEEMLTGSNQYACETCQRKCNASRRFELRALPPILNLQLMRFVFDLEHGNKRKLKESVQIPDIIDVSALLASQGCALPEEDPAVYELTAVLYHKGQSAHHGHYVADAWDDRRGVWWTFDDESVQPVSANSCDGDAEPDASDRSPQRSAAADAAERNAAIWAEEAVERILSRAPAPSASTMQPDERELARKRPRAEQQPAAPSGDIDAISTVEPELPTAAPQVASAAAALSQFMPMENSKPALGEFAPIAREGSALPATITPAVVDIGAEAGRKGPVSPSFDDDALENSSAARQTASMMLGSRRRDAIAVSLAADDAAQRRVSPVQAVADELVVQREAGRGSPQQDHHKPRTASAADAGTAQGAFSTARMLHTQDAPQSASAHTPAAASPVPMLSDPSQQAGTYAIRRSGRRSRTPTPTPRADVRRGFVPPRSLTASSTVATMCSQPIRLSSDLHSAVPVVPSAPNGRLTPAVSSDMPRLDSQRTDAATLHPQLLPRSDSEVQTTALLHEAFTTSSNDAAATLAGEQHAVKPIPMPTTCSSQALVCETSAGSDTSRPAVAVDDAAAPPQSAPSRRRGRQSEKTPTAVQSSEIATASGRRVTRGRAAGNATASVSASSPASGQGGDVGASNALIASATSAVPQPPVDNAVTPVTACAVEAADVAEVHAGSQPALRTRRQRSRAPHTAAPQSGALAEASSIKAPPVSHDARGQPAATFDLRTPILPDPAASACVRPRSDMAPVPASRAAVTSIAAVNTSIVDTIGADDSGPEIVDCASDPGRGVNRTHRRRDTARPAVSGRPQLNLLRVRAEGASSDTSTQTRDPGPTRNVAGGAMPGREQEAAWTAQRSHPAYRTGVGSRNAYMLVYRRISRERLAAWPEWQAGGTTLPNATQASAAMSVPATAVARLPAAAAAMEPKHRGQRKAPVVPTPEKRRGGAKKEDADVPDVMVVEAPASTSTAGTLSSGTIRIPVRYLRTLPPALLLPSSDAVSPPSRLLDHVLQDNSTFMREQRLWAVEHALITRAILRRRALVAAAFLDPAHPATPTLSAASSALERRAAPAGLSAIASLDAARSWTTQLISVGEGVANGDAAVVSRRGATSRRAISADEPGFHTKEDVLMGAADTEVFVVPAGWLRNWVCGADVGAEDAQETDLKKAARAALKDANYAAPGRVIRESIEAARELAGGSRSTPHVAVASEVIVLDDDASPGGTGVLNSSQAHVGVATSTAALQAAGESRAEAASDALDLVEENEQQHAATSAEDAPLIAQLPMDPALIDDSLAWDLLSRAHRSVWSGPMQLRSVLQLVESDGSARKGQLALPPGMATHHYKFITGRALRVILGDELPADADPEVILRACRGLEASPSSHNIGGREMRETPSNLQACVVRTAAVGRPTGVPAAAVGRATVAANDASASVAGQKRERSTSRPGRAPMLRGAVAASARSKRKVNSQNEALSTLPDDSGVIEVDAEADVDCTDIHDDMQGAVAGKQSTAPSDKYPEVEIASIPEQPARPGKRGRADRSARPHSGTSTAAKAAASSDVLPAASSSDTTSRKRGRAARVLAPASPQGGADAATVTMQEIKPKRAEAKREGLSSGKEAGGEEPLLHFIRIVCAVPALHRPIEPDAIITLSDARSASLEAAWSAKLLAQFDSAVHAHRCLLALAAPEPLERDIAVLRQGGAPGAACRSAEPTSNSFTCWVTRRWVAAVRRWLQSCRRAVAQAVARDFGSQPVHHIEPASGASTLPKPATQTQGGSESTGAVRLHDDAVVDVADEGEAIDDDTDGELSAASGLLCPHGQLLGNNRARRRMWWDTWQLITTFERQHGGKVPFPTRSFLPADGPNAIAACSRCAVRTLHFCAPLISARLARERDVQAETVAERDRDAAERSRRTSQAQGVLKPVCSNVRAAMGYPKPSQDHDALRSGFLLAGMYAVLRRDWMQQWRAFVSSVTAPRPPSVASQTWPRCSHLCGGEHPDGRSHIPLPLLLFLSRTAAPVPARVSLLESKQDVSNNDSVASRLASVFGTPLNSVCAIDDRWSKAMRTWQKLCASDPHGTIGESLSEPPAGLRPLGSPFQLDVELLQVEEFKQLRDLYEFENTTSASLLPLAAFAAATRAAVESRDVRAVRARSRADAETCSPAASPIAQVTPSAVETEAAQCADATRERAEPGTDGDPANAAARANDDAAASPNDGAAASPKDEAAASASPPRADVAVAEGHVLHPATFAPKLDASRARLTTRHAPAGVHSSEVEMHVDDQAADPVPPTCPHPQPESAPSPSGVAVGTAYQAGESTDLPASSLPSHLDAEPSAVDVPQTTTESPAPFVRLVQATTPLITQRWETAPMILVTPVGWTREMYAFSDASSSVPSATEERTPNTLCGAWDGPGDYTWNAWPPACSDCFLADMEAEHVARHRFEAATVYFVELSALAATPGVPAAPSGDQTADGAPARPRRQTRKAGKGNARHAVTISSSDRLDVVRMKLMQVAGLDALPSKLFVDGRLIAEPSTVADAGIWAGDTVYFRLRGAEALDDFDEYGVVSGQGGAERGFAGSRLVGQGLATAAS